MSHFPSDPAFVRQFRRAWSGDSMAIKFIAELSNAELDHLVIASGERFIQRLPETLTNGLTAGERRDLARAFGRPVIRRMRERRP